MINIYKRCETKSVVSKQKNKSILCCRCNISQNFAAKHVKAMKCKNISFSFLDNIRNAPYKTRPYNLFATPSLLFSCPVGQRTVALYNMQHVTLTFVSSLLLLISSFTLVLAFVVFVLLLLINKICTYTYTDTDTDARNMLWCCSPPEKAKESSQTSCGLEHSWKSSRNSLLAKHELSMF